MHVQIGSLGMPVCFALIQAGAAKKCFFTQGPRYQLQPHRHILVIKAAAHAHAGQAGEVAAQREDVGFIHFEGRRLFTHSTGDGGRGWVRKGVEGRSARECYGGTVHLALGICNNEGRVGSLPDFFVVQSALGWGYPIVLPAGVTLTGGGHFGAMSMLFAEDKQNIG